MSLSFFVLNEQNYGLKDFQLEHLTDKAARYVVSSTAKSQHSLASAVADPQGSNESQCAQALR